MTDPLSISTAALAFIGASVQLAKGISYLKDTRKLPEDFATLLSEVSLLHDTLVECQQHLESSKTVHRIHDLYKHGKHAKERLQELSDSVSSWTRKNGFTSKSEIKAFWSDIVHGQKRVCQARDQLRDIRQALSVSLQVVTAPVVYGINSKIDEVCGAQKEILAVVSAQQATHELLLNGIAAITLHAQAVASSSKADVELPSYETAVKQSGGRRRSSGVKTRRTMTRNKPAPRPDHLPAQVNNNADFQLPEDRLGRYCMPWCSCQCHESTFFDSNDYDYVGNVFGRLSIQYSGMPAVTKSCNETRTCKGRFSPKLKLRYRLPFMIAKRQFLNVNMSWFAGAESRVKLPRVVDWSSPVWHHATVGNTQAVENMFRLGLASPWDVSPVGGNLLHYATDHWNPELCKLLIEEGQLDPEAEDDFKSTGVGIAWARVLSGRASTDEASIIASLFRNTDYISSCNFSVIHKIVLGLVHQDLAQQLELSTASINSQDTTGRTPLSWAAARGDVNSLTTLLVYQANPNISDKQGQSPLHYAQNVRCAELLLEANADINALNQEGQKPLYMAAREVRVREPALIQLFLDRGADPNHLDHASQGPLHNIHGPAHPYFDTLLAAGATVNCPNDSGDTPLRFMVIYNWHDTLKRVLEDEQRSKEADFGIINFYGQSFAHGIARTADLETVRILTEHQPKSLVPRLELKDRAGKLPSDYFEERMRILAEEDQDLLRDAFAGLMAAVGGNEARDGVDVVGGMDKEAGVTVTEIETFHDAVESF